MPTSAPPYPGRGAAHLVRPRSHYVYIDRARRTGRPSLSIDLTSNGACPFACDYCQVPRQGRETTPPAIDLAQLRSELQSALDRFGFLAGAVTFSGSGEPTWSPQFAPALAVARQLATSRPKPMPVRVLTSGVALDRQPVAKALSGLVRSGDGEVWVKLDAWNEPGYRRAAGVRGYAEQEKRIIRFARTTPTVLQIMCVHRRDGVTTQDAASGLKAAIERLASAGCSIDRVVLSTLFRPPGDPSSAVAPLDEVEIALLADAIASAGVDVAMPGDAA